MSSTPPSRVERARQRYLANDTPDPRLAAHPELQAARRAGARLVLYLAYTIEWLRADVRGDLVRTLPAHRGQIRAVVDELNNLIEEAGVTLGPLHLELEEARGRIPSSHEEVVDFAK